MATTIKAIDTSAAVTKLVGKLEAQASGELGSMFAAYQIANKLDKRGRDALVDSAVDQAMSGEDDKRISNVRNRTKVFFGASRHFVAEPATVDDHVFAKGNGRSVTEAALKEALDTARKACVALVDGATTADLKSSSGERYAWASALNAVEPSAAAVLLTGKGIATFFADRLRPHVDARILTEAAAKAAAIKEAEEAKAAADLVEARAPEAPELTSLAEQVAKIASDRKEDKAADKIKANTQSPNTAPTAPAKAPASAPIPAPGNPSMSAKADPSAQIEELPKAPAAAKNLFKKVAMHCLTLGMTSQDLRAMLAEVGKAHDVKAKADAPKPDAKAQASIVSAILG